MAVKIPSGWILSHGQAGRPNYTSPDGKVRIQDGGFGVERFQVLRLENGKLLEDLGWPSLTGAFEYVLGGRRIQDHPAHKMTDEKRRWNQRMRDENARGQTMTTAAATYVQISREDLEAWLGHLHHKWTRAPNKAGIYLIHLSDVVAVKLSSTIGTSDDALGRGQASMQLALVSLVTGQTLNRKAQGQGHFKRTTNWQKTWAEGIERMRDAYMKAQGFYDAIAAIADRDKYKTETLAKIESIPGWQNVDILGDFHKRIMQDGILTAKQMAVLDRMVADRQVQKPAPKPPESGPKMWALVPHDSGQMGEMDVWSSYDFHVTGPDRVEYSEFQSHMDGVDKVDGGHFSFAQAAEKWALLLKQRNVPSKDNPHAAPPFLASAPVPAARPGRDDAFYQRLRSLYVEAQRNRNQWLMDFLANVGPRVRDGLILSPKQQAVLDENLQRYRLAAIRRVATRYLFRT